ncbi:MAG: glycerol-3-phosphate acyltransferase [Coriobacteriales bacterium]|nr:glycerol-3-phosphate acyltransferase [Coriobacteriales bacterium]
MDFFSRALCLLVGYLCGCILTADLVARHMAGRRAFELGDGNPGMANVGHCLGFRAAAYTLAGDLGKVILAAVVAGLSFPALGSAAIAWAGLGTTLGHNYPFWHRFRGGKGVATTCATIVLSSPIWGGLSCIAGFVVVVATQYLCLGALAIPAAFVVAMLAFGTPDLAFVAVALLALMLPQHLPAVRGIATGQTPKANIAQKVRQKLPWAARAASDAGHTAAWMAQRGAEAAERGVSDAGRAVAQASTAAVDAVAQVGRDMVQQATKSADNRSRSKALERKRMAAVTRNGAVELEGGASTARPRTMHAGMKPAVARRARNETHSARATGLSRQQRAYQPRYAASSDVASVMPAAHVSQQSAAVVGNGVSMRRRARYREGTQPSAQVRRPSTTVRRPESHPKRGLDDLMPDFDDLSEWTAPLPPSPNKPRMTPQQGAQTSAPVNEPQTTGATSQQPSAAAQASAETQPQQRQRLDPGSTAPMVIPKVFAPYNQSDPFQRALTKVQQREKEAAAQAAAEQETTEQETKGQAPTEQAKDASESSASPEAEAAQKSDAQAEADAPSLSDASSTPDTADKNN